jgi:hypothetical protein
LRNLDHKYLENIMKRSLNFACSTGAWVGTRYRAAFGFFYFFSPDPPG